MNESKVFLAYEWIEEREGKNHIGVFSTLDKAKAACQKRWDAKAQDYGRAQEMLAWHDLSTLPVPMVGSWTGFKTGGDSYDEDYPYEVEAFDLDQ